MASKLICLSLIVLFALLSLNSCFLKTEDLSKRKMYYAANAYDEAEEVDAEANLLQTSFKNDEEEEENERSFKNTPSVLLQTEKRAILDDDEVVEGGETFRVVRAAEADEAAEAAEATEGKAKFAKLLMNEEEDD